MKRTPRIWRKRRGRGGKFYGSCLVTIAGVDVNLGTDDNELARKRLPAALKGKRDFERDVDVAAAASEPGVEGAAAGTTDIPAIPSLGPDPASAAAAPPAPAAPLLLPASSPASDADAQAEAEATNAAAAETGGAGGAQGEPLEPDALFPPEALDSMLEACAGAVVELQLELQGWVIKKRTGKVPGKVPEDSKIRSLAAQAWVAQLKRWFPDMETVPPWVIAVALPAMCMPAQLANATDPPKEAEKQADPMPAQAAA